MVAIVVTILDVAGTSDRLKPTLVLQILIDFVNGTRLIRMILSCLNFSDRRGGDCTIGDSVSLHAAVLEDPA